MSLPAEPWISHGCQFPTDQQAVLVPSDMKRRHPYAGLRPEYSGYCVIDQCDCECHQAQPEIGEEVNIDDLDP